MSNIRKDQYIFNTISGIKNIDENIIKALRDRGYTIVTMHDYIECMKEVRDELYHSGSI